MRHHFSWIIISIVFCGTVKDSHGAFSAVQAKPLIQKYKKLVVQKEAAENESGLQSIEKIANLEQEIEQLVAKIKAVIPNWQDSDETNVAFDNPSSTFETRLSQKKTVTSPQKSHQEYKDFLTKEMASLRIKMLDQQDLIAKVTDAQERIKLQQDLRRMGQEMKLLRGSLNEIGTSGVGKSKIMTTPQLSMDLKNVDQDHERFLQDQLQETYEKIYVLREKSLEEQSGEILKNLGNEITKLENEELSLTRRLLAMGVKPLPPKILEKNKNKNSKQPKAEVEVYREELNKRIKEVFEEIRFLQGMKKKITSGSAMAELGLQIARRESEIKLLKETLTEISPKTKKPVKLDNLQQASPPHKRKQEISQSMEKLQKSPNQLSEQPPVDVNRLLQSPALTSPSKPLWGADYIPQDANIVPQEVKLNDQEIHNNQAINIERLIDHSTTAQHTASMPMRASSTRGRAPATHWGMMRS